MGSLDKPGNHANLIERQKKRKKITKIKFLTISILKNKIDKNIYFLNHNKETKRKGKKKLCVQKIKTMCGLAALNFELT